MTSNISSVSNLAFKSAVVLSTDGAEMARRVLPAFAALAAATGLILLAW